MTDKPGIGAEYLGDDMAVVRAGLLYIATKVGDIMEDIVVVGGLVPSLIIDQESGPDGEYWYPSFQKHVGTRDLDLGLDLAILREERYSQLSMRLRGAGLTPDANSQGNLTRQRWRLQGSNTLTVDFLVQPVEDGDSGGTLRNIEPDFAAVVTPGLRLAFADRRKVTISGQTAMSEWAERDIWVCGPGAFIVLKAIAFQNRGENKDAYDMFYVLRSAMFNESLRNDLLSFLSVQRRDTEVQRAINSIRLDFTDHDGVGPRRTAEFVTGGTDDQIQADVVGFVSRLLRLIQTD